MPIQEGDIVEYNGLEMRVLLYDGEDTVMLQRLRHKDDSVFPMFMISQLKKVTKNDAQS